MNAAIKNILVPVNFSRTSAKAVEAAISLSKEHNAELHLLHIDDWEYNISADGYLPSYIATTCSKRDRKRDINVLASFIHRLFHVRCYGQIKEGPVVQTIAAYALEYKCELVVVGTRPKINKRVFVNDSLAFRLLAMVHCPVLTVPLSRKEKIFKRILFPVRRVNNNLEKFDLVNHVSGYQKSSFHILGMFEHGGKTDMDIIKRMFSFVKRRVREENLLFTQAVHLYPDPASRVVDAAKQTSADLIVITASTTRNFWQFFFGNYTQRVINNTHAAVLCVKE